jgi:hypothetical protein
MASQEENKTFVNGPQNPQLSQESKNQPGVIAMMTTEHYNLQSGRSMTISEAIGRSSLFLSTVSTALVALAFVAQIAHMGTEFYAFALILFPSPSSVRSR